MIPVRIAPDVSRNPRIGYSEPPPRNAAAIREALGRLRRRAAILLVGGNDLLHFRLRVAQSHSRHDHLPSFWSHVAILATAGGELRMHEVALDPADGFRGMPRTNGADLHAALERYDDPARFPNIALIAFPLDGADVTERASEISMDRGVLGLGRALLGWLGYVWGTGSGENPLTQGVGIPSAQFAEAVYGALGLELTPGLETRASSPEAIWQAALYWHRYYTKRERDRSAASGEKQDAPAQNPIHGVCWLRQPAAAVVEPSSATPPWYVVAASQAARRKRARRARPKRRA